MSIRQKFSNNFLKIRENYFIQEHLDTARFEDAYLNIREKEQRLYSDDVVRKLPDYDGDASLRFEWAIRKYTLKRLVDYVNEKDKQDNILEVGCGNGWLSHRLATETRGNVVGIDINKKELTQAARIFLQIPNLTFLHADVFELTFLHRSFSSIILASCIQYFPDPHFLISKLFELLDHGGEIHIVDSPFYRPSEIDAARQRSDRYFASRESVMSKFYFHHSLKALDGFNYKIIYRPTLVSAMLRRLRVPRSPFPWIRISK